MPLKRRVGLVAGAAVGVAVLIALIVSYLVVRGQLLDQVDGALNAQMAAIQNHQLSLGESLPGIPPSAGGPAQSFQIIGSDGSALPGGNIALPINSQAKSVANGNGGAYLTDINAEGTHWRVLTFPVSFRVGLSQPMQGAVQLARPLNGTDHILSNLRLILFLLFLGGIALAAALGRLAARRVLAPLSEVAQTATYIGETDDLSRRITVHADDEVGQLATRFNTMLEHLEGSRSALDESVRAQRQLVADASHELRTPVTSLRTNIEVLLAGGEISEEDRKRLLTDVVEQSEELSALVSDLIDLARGDEPQGETEDVRLDRVVEESLARARRNAPGLRFEARLEPVTLEGVAERLERAVNNLLDNAARHSPPAGTVEVDVDSAGVRVRDHGPGIDEEDLPHVFDRFYRGANVRGQQGSGLGLSIVRQVTQQHGGSVTAANARDGGALFTMHLPVMSTDGEAPVLDSSAGATAPDVQDGAATTGAAAGEPANGANDAASAARSAAGERP
jgi:two-component system, OmpR family, sensor histidine kinase MprB